MGHPLEHPTYTIPVPEPEKEEEELTFPYASWGAMTAVGVSLLALFAGLLLSLPFLAIAGIDSEEDASAGTLIALQTCTALGFILIPILVAAGASGGFRNGLRRLGFVSFRPLQALAWAGIGITFYLAFAILYSNLIGQPEQEEIAERFGSLPAQILLIVIAAPLAEEICFRGFLFGGLRKRMPMIPAALAGGLFFGLLHFSTGWSAVPLLVVLGAMFAVVYEKTGSLWPPIILHAVNNGLALAVLTAS
jgi:membrane protease YdiL (CAAX protease family)